MEPFPRHLRPVQDPPGLYFAPGHNGHTSLHKRLLELTEERSPFRGVLLAAPRSDVQEDLRQELHVRKLEAILDTKALELSTAAGFEKSTLRTLPWSGNRIHRPEDLSGAAGRELADAVTKHALEKKYSGMLTPTHFIRTPDDLWLDVDRRNTVRTRRFLDANGAEHMPLYYLLAIHSKVLFAAEARHEIIRALANLDIDGVWLRVHPFGFDAGPVALRRYMEACHDLHQLHIPIIAEKVGSTGLALLAFGSVGGICCGLTLGEKFDALQLDRPRKPGSGGNMSPRVYIEVLGAFLSKEQAEAFYALGNRTQAKYGCRDKACCRRGVEDTIADPQRHFIYARARELEWLGNAPPTARPGIYMNDFLRPASDKAIKAADLEPALVKVRDQLADWRETLRVIEANGVSSYARVPKAQRLRRRRLRALNS
jgi:hypothetical protein